VTDQHGLSSAHATFVAADQVPLFEAAGWLIRTGTQFHWRNQGYADFDAFLATLASRKRKAIRKERAAAVDGLTIRHVTGGDLSDADWDAFWTFYQDTALSVARVLLTAGRADGGQGAADSGRAGRRADRRRAQPDRRGYAIRAILGL
jgi:predicted N-acyltransferase